MSHNIVDTLTSVCVIHAFRCIMPDTDALVLLPFECPEYLILSRHLEDGVLVAVKIGLYKEVLVVG